MKNWRAKHKLATNSFAATFPIERKSKKTFGLAWAYTVKPRANSPKLKTLPNIQTNGPTDRSSVNIHRRSEKIPGILSIDSQHKITGLDQNRGRDEKH